MMYSFLPQSEVITIFPVCRSAMCRPTISDNMVRRWPQDVEFDLAVQVQTDPQRMPIENAAVRWPEKLSPFVPAATIRIPRQNFDTPAHVALAKTLSLNPWHCLARASPARQPEPGAAADVCRAVPVAPGPEPDAAHGADRKRAAHLAGGSPRPTARCRRLRASAFARRRTHSRAS